MHARIIVLLLLFTSVASASLLPKRWDHAVDVKLMDIALGEKIIVKEKSLIGVIFYLGKDFSILKDCLFVNEKKVFSYKTVEIKKNCKEVIEAKGAILSSFYNMNIERKLNAVLFHLDKDTWSINIKNEDESFDITYASAIGSRLNNHEVCHNINDSCQESGPNICLACKSGHTNIINSNCINKFSKVCGTFTCGKKDSYVCIRGRRGSEYSGDYCINDSPLGFCEKPLRVLCVDGKLICR